MPVGSENERHVRRLVAERRVPYLKWATCSVSTPAEIERWLDDTHHNSRSA